MQLAAGDENSEQAGKAQTNLQEGHHDLWRCVFADSAANCDAATTRARKTSSRARPGPDDEDIARLIPYLRKHINVYGRYAFTLPELPGGRRELRDTDQSPHDEDNRREAIDLTRPSIG